MRFTKENNAVFDLTYHLVLVTKYRRPAIDDEIKERLRDLIRIRCEAWGGVLKEFNGEADHVHLLFSLPPIASLASFVNNTKTTTSRLVRKEFATRLARHYWKPVFWSRSYCVVTTGGASIEVVRRYIEQQGQHKTASPPTKRA